LMGIPPGIAPLRASAPLAPDIIRKWSQRDDARNLLA
jgi:hypothetical protein